jgi:cobalt-zinc-cadmium efflux system outer membrane protein
LRASAKFALSKLQLALAILFVLLLPPALLAQAMGTPSSGATGTTVSTTGSATATHPTPFSDTSQQTAGRQAIDQTPQSTAAAAYAAGVSTGPDPRKPPKSRPGAYTLAQIVDLAQAKNPTLLAADQNLRAVRAQELQAGIRANPYLTFYGTDVTQGPNAPTPYNFSLQTSRLFERGEKRRWRLDDARATTAQTHAQLDDTVRQTLLAVKTAFTHMLIAKEAAELSDASLKDFRHEVDIANDRYKAGDLAKLDFERLDLQLGNFESDEADDRIALHQASDQLQTLIGIEVPSSVFDVAGDIVPPLITETQSMLLQAAFANRPDYAAAKFGVDAAQANARLAVANGTTDPTLEAEYDRSGDENSVGFSVNIPLRLFDHNQGNKETAKFQFAASQLTATATRNQVVSDVDQAWATYIEAKKLSDRFGNHYLDESHDVLDIAQFSFEHGGIALIDYLDALRDARSSTSDALNAYQQTWLAIHQLGAASATEVIP